MINRIGLFAVVSLIAGCVTLPPAQKDWSPTSLQGETMVVINREKPDFVAMTPATAAFALLGAVAAIKNGNKFVDDNHVEDPAVAIRRHLAETATQQFSMKTSELTSDVDFGDAAGIAKLAKDQAHFVLDVRSGIWTFIYFPLKWNHYRVRYAAQAILIDTRTSTVVATSLCKQNFDDEEHSPTYEELTDDNAAGLKRISQSLGDACEITLKSDLFKK